APGADPSTIEMQIDGAKKLSLDAKGNLILGTAGSDLVELAPVLYQNIDGAKRSVEGSFVLKGANRVAFLVAEYDHAKELVIDPTLAYSSYLGNNTNVAVSLALDSSANAYIAGTVGGFTTSTLGKGVVVEKINSSGSALVYKTTLGTTTTGEGTGIA